MPDPVDKTAPASPVTLAVPRAIFDRVPSKRAAYILAYAVFVVGTFGPRIAVLFGASVPAGAISAGYVVGLMAFAVFAFHFYTTLRIMGYERIFASAMVVVAAPLIPGFFFVAFMDRRIATAWDAVDPSGGYRQRPPTAGPTKE